MNKMIVRFPFQISQIAPDAVEVVVQAHGFAFPEIHVNGASMDSFNIATGLTRERHEQVLEEVQDEYLKRLVIATLSVETR